MKRRRTRKQKLSVSLFPFLAVLICTLGVLIVLLVLAVKSAAVEADEEYLVQKEKVEKQTETVKQLSGELDDIETKIEVINVNRPDGLEELSKSREYRGHLEAEIRKLKQSIEAIDEALAQQDTHESPEIDTEAAKAEVDRLTQKILLAEKELTKKRQEIQANAKVTYSIVPHAGNGGTFRRPIFIESRRDALIIQPLGIELRSDDFVPPLGPGNPLDAAVLAIREYWQKHQVTDSEESPYPLIVIRPEGSEGYAVCRRALISWEDEFGYELVESNKELDFGKVDTELKLVVEAAIAEARLRQQKMLAARPARQAGFVKQAGFRTGQGGYNRGSTRKSNQRPGLTVSANGGGFVVDSGWEDHINRNDGFGGSGAGSNPDGNGDSASNLFGGQSGTGTIQRQPLNGNGSSTSAQAAQSQAAQSSGNQAGAAQTGSQNPSAGDSFDATSSSEAFASGEGQTGNSGGPTGVAGSSSGGPGGTQAGGDAQCENCDNSPPSLMYQHMNVAKTKGRNWALPSKTRGSTAYVRPIRIVCTDSALEVMSPLGVEKSIPIKNSVQDAVDPLVNEIWRQIESWGIPGERSYWKPELRISVVAGGEENFEMLQGLLFDSGIQIKESAR